MTVSVLVPWRGGCPARQAAWEYVRRWWAETHPGWQVVTGACPDGGPWSKGAAVADAATQAHGDIAVVADADVVCHGVTAAVDAVAGGAPWAVPHKAVHRLTPDVTAAVLAGAPLPDIPHPRGHLGVTLAETYTGVAGGGIAVLPAATLAAVPIDPRFRGWGQEDTAWAWALHHAAGGAWRGTATLWHLWHPPAPRRSRSVGSPESLALYRRYRTAHTPAEIRALLAEIPNP